MKVNPRQIGPLRAFLLIVVTVVLMAVCGVGAFVGTLTYLMSQGLKNQGNYEYYGQTPARYLLFLVGAVGFAVPGLIVWHLLKRRIIVISSRFSLHELLVDVTIAASIIGFASALYRGLLR